METPGCPVVCSRTWPLELGHSVGRGPEKSRLPFVAEAGFEVSTADCILNKASRDWDIVPILLPGGFRAAGGKAAQLGG